MLIIGDKNMAWWGRGRGWRGGQGGWMSPWPGRGPFSYLPPWQRPGWIFGRGWCWRFFGYPMWWYWYGYPGYGFYGYPWGYNPYYSWYPRYPYWYPYAWYGYPWW